MPNKPLAVSPATYRVAKFAVRTIATCVGLGTLAVVMLRAEHMTVRQQAKTEKQEAQVAVDRTSKFGRVIMDASGKIISWNRGMSDTTGWRADEMIGKNIAEIIPKGSPDLEAILAGEADGRNVTIRRAGTKHATVLVKLNAYSADGFRYVTARPAGELNSL